MPRRRCRDRAAAARRQQCQVGGTADANSRVRARLRPAAGVLADAGAARWCWRPTTAGWNQVLPTCAAPTQLPPPRSRAVSAAALRPVSAIAPVYAHSQQRPVVPTYGSRRTSSPRIVRRRWWRPASPTWRAASAAGRRPRSDRALAEAVRPMAALQRVQSLTRTSRARPASILPVTCSLLRSLPPSEAGSCRHTTLHGVSADGAVLPTAWRSLPRRARPHAGAAHERAADWARARICGPVRADPTAARRHRSLPHRCLGMAQPGQDLLGQANCALRGWIALPLPPRPFQRRSRASPAGPRTKWSTCCAAGARRATVSGP